MKKLLLSLLVYGFHCYGSVELITVNRAAYTLALSFFDKTGSFQNDDAFENLRSQLAKLGRELTQDSWIKVIKKIEKIKSEELIEENIDGFVPVLFKNIEKLGEGCMWEHGVRARLARIYPSFQSCEFDPVITRVLEYSEELEKMKEEQARQVQQQLHRHQQLQQQQRQQRQQELQQQNKESGKRRYRD